jgi:hypothetical protein
VDTSVVALARDYRNRSNRSSVGSPLQLVGALAQRYRTRRWQRLQVIIARVNELSADDAPPTATAAEARDYVAKQFADSSTAPQGDEERVAFRATCFDLLVRDLLNAGERVADLRLRPGQRAVLVPTAIRTTLGVTASSSAPWTAQQQRALDELAQVRDAVVGRGVANVNLVPLPAGVEWRELTAQMVTRRSRMAESRPQ